MKLAVGREGPIILAPPLPLCLSLLKFGLLFCTAKFASTRINYAYQVTFFVCFYFSLPSATVSSAVPKQCAKPRKMHSYSWVTVSDFHISFACAPAGG